MGNANQHLQQSELSSKYGKNRISRSALKCPQCDVVVDWGNERVCSNGHSIRSVAGIPLCFSPESYLEKHTADPSYELVHSIGIAEFLNAECETFDSAINLFFDTRELELKAKLTSERKLYAQRKVPQYSQSIVDASALLSRIGLAFPSRNRFHLDIGCGMGFELAASSKSYFGVM